MCNIVTVNIVRLSLGGRNASAEEKGGEDASLDTEMWLCKNDRFKCFIKSLVSTEYAPKQTGEMLVKASKESILRTDLLH